LIEKGHFLEINGRYYRVLEWGIRTAIGVVEVSLKDIPAHLLREIDFSDLQHEADAVSEVAKKTYKELFAVYGRSMPYGNNKGSPWAAFNLDWLLYGKGKPNLDSPRHLEHKATQFQEIFKEHLIEYAQARLYENGEDEGEVLNNESSSPVEHYPLAIPPVALEAISREEALQKLFLTMRVVSKETGYAVIIKNNPVYRVNLERQTAMILLRYGKEFSGFAPPKEFEVVVTSNPALTDSFAAAYEINPPEITLNLYFYILPKPQQNIILNRLFYHLAFFNLSSSPVSCDPDNFPEVYVSENLPKDVLSERFLKGLEKVSYKYQCVGSVILGILRKFRDTDPDTCAHCERTMQYAVLLAWRMIQEEDDLF
jgi:hypothetical protein